MELRKQADTKWRRATFGLSKTVMQILLSMGQAQVLDGKMKKERYEMNI
jgi:hypothetical protein